MIHGSHHATNTINLGLSDCRRHGSGNQRGAECVLFWRLPTLPTPSFAFPLVSVSKKDSRRDDCVLFLFADVEHVNQLAQAVTTGDQYPDEAQDAAARCQQARGVFSTFRACCRTHATGPSYSYSLEFGSIVLHRRTKESTSPHFGLGPAHFVMMQAVTHN